MPDQVPEASIDTTAGPPIVSGVPEEVADGVFVIPDGRVPLVPNVGVVVGDEAALVIDTGIGPRSGAIVRDIAGQLAGDRPLILTLTHFHPEHGYGAQAFGDATLLYNREQEDEFHVKAQGYLDTFRDLGGEVAKELEGVEFVDPQEVYDGERDIDLGGKVVQLRSRGPAHTLGDQSAFLPEDRILFTGDLVENRFYPIFPYFPPYDVDVDGANWIEVLKELEGLKPEIVVPGHGEMSDVTLIAENREYLELFQSEVKRLSRDGKEAGEIIGALTQAFAERHPDWDASEPWRVATAVQSFLAAQ